MTKTLKRLKPITTLVLLAFLLQASGVQNIAFAHCPTHGGTELGVTQTGDPEKSDNNSENGRDCGDLEPIFLDRGEFFYKHTDVSIPSSRGLPIKITRNYQSQKAEVGPFGYGWFFNYRMRVKALANGNILLHNKNGKINEFTYDAGAAAYIGPPGVYETLTDNGNDTFTLKDRHGIQHYFDSDGKLTHITDRNGNQTTLSYGRPGVPIQVFAYWEFNNPPGEIVVAYDFQVEQITDSNGNYVSLTYDDHGRIETITDSASRTWTYSYDDFGNLASVLKPATDEYPDGLTISYAYDNRHNLETVTDEKEQVYLTNHYNAEDRVDVQTYGPGTSNISYDPENNTTTYTDFKGFEHELIYDDDTNPILEKVFTAGLHPGEPEFYQTTYEHNAYNERTKITYPAGNGIKYTFNEENENPLARGNLLEIRRKPDMSQPNNDDADIITAFTYEPNFNFVKTITDPKGNVTTYTYDYELDPENPRYAEAGNLVTITYPAVTAGTPEVQFTYNEHGQLAEVIDPNINLTQYEYQAGTGYLWKIIQDPAGINAITEFDYDAYGNLASVTDARQQQTIFLYNKLNWLLEQTDPLGHVTKYSYDQNGNLARLERQADANSNFWQTTQYTHTALDQLASVTDPLNHTTAFTYDNNGNRASMTDPKNNTTTYEYDERDSLWKTTDAASAVTEYSYDLNGNLSFINDARESETTYAHDGFDRVFTTTYADTSFSQFTYDKNSNLIVHQPPKFATTGETIEYDYDQLNRLEAKRFPLNPSADVSFDYDLGSRLNAVSNQPSAISYQYDTLNRIEASTQTIASTPYTLSYSYDDNGNRTSVTYPSGRVQGYEYDELNRMENVTGVAGYQYDILGRREKITRANNTFTDYRYDEANRLVQMAHYDERIPISEESRQQQYGSRERRGRPQPPQEGWLSWLKPSAISRQLSAKSFKLKTESRLPLRLVFEENSRGKPKANRILSFFFSLWSVHDAEAINQIAVPIGTFSYYHYNYDRAGNRTLLRSNKTEEGYGYDDVYQLVSSQSSGVSNQFAYDAVGNREVVDGVNYTTNNLNQYTEVGGVAYSYDGNGNLASEGVNNYTYDVENHLSSVSGLQSSVYQYDGLGRRVSKDVDGEITYFIYDGDRVIEERSASGALLRDYVYGNGIDEVLTLKTYNLPLNTYYYYSDGLGSITDITDETGDIVETYTYDVYGKPTIRDTYHVTLNTSSVGNSYMFTGRRYDEESGLYYYRARYYSPEIGRFLQRDPIGYEDDTNLYRYVKNNPINWVDPWGLWGERGSGHGWKAIDPNYGNWGGINWSGGRYIKKGEIGDLGIPGIDSLDDLYKRHDRETHCKKPKADDNLIEGLRRLPRDPRKWKRPPKIEWWARIHRKLAESWF